MTENQATPQEAGWKFDNSYARLPQSFYAEQSPARVRSPKTVILNEPLAARLGLNVGALQGEDGAAVLAGNRIPEGARPLAQAYAGHQFEYFNMLGDGRALLLGEQLAPDGERFDIQLKGSGRTAYSRGGDGRAALGPMLREYIISEAMFALGIPTTRSLAVTATGEPVIREMQLPGAVLTRVAASHLRVGTFQYAANMRTVEELRALADYALQRHYPDADGDGNRYLALLRGVGGRQAELIAKWQLVGFIHGVMNTDNMTISGETIDYGPCAFLDAYDPATVFSSIDRQGRYAYGNQPRIAAWNLARLAESLLPLLHEDEERAVELAEDALEEFIASYQRHWLAGMRAKLGIADEEPEDESLIGDLLAMMQKHRADYTNTFLAMTFGKPTDTAMFGSAEFERWRERWQARAGRQPEDARASSHALMRVSNPAVIPRNHRVEEALAAAEQGDFTVMERLLHVLSKPYAHASEQAEYAELPEPSGRPYRTFCGT
ncbi:protein adenylyltransferase SelO [Paenibacillus glycinis]|uniref:Protein nucleotidyltransferase YdiU n=1 Tax=Paenibacillus glycinis TaxID=2697035 RepID=A0ABW9XPV0_9BACL|nr:YdiU family protein [Paenibacillus glycinis]NBD24658.1 YdiU family protein [Paenibacillus glycinis]